jgi:hypothetical protein
MFVCIFFVYLSLDYGPGTSNQCSAIQIFRPFQTMSKRQGTYLVVFVYISLPFCYHIICLLIMGRACQTNLSYSDFRTFPNNAQAPRHLSRCVCLHLTSLLPLHHHVLVIFMPLSSWSWMVTGGICSSYLPNLFLLHLFCIQRKTAFGAKQEGPTLDGSVHCLLVYPTTGAHGSYRKCADLKLCSPEEQEQAAQCSRVYWARYRQKYVVWLCAIWSCWH